MTPPSPVERAARALIDPKGLRGFRPERRQSCEPDSTEGREIAHAIADAEARRQLALTRRVTMIDTMIKEAESA